MNRTSARLLAGLILSCGAAASASPAHAATPSITGDGGAPVPLTAGTTLRHMAPDVSFAFTAEEQYYAARVVGPAGPASTGVDCLRTSSPLAERVRYQGNGAYTLIFKTGKDSAACKSAPEQSVPFTINASTSVVAPEKQPLLMREPGSFASIPYEVPVNGNPGADSYEMKYALNATLGPDGGITSMAESAFVNSSTGRATVRFTKPGRYTFVLRAKTGRSDVPTPWSPRMDVNVVAPFDLSAVTPTDRRGPSYAFTAAIRETSARGKVAIAIGKGKNPKRFKRLGSAKIGKSGKFKKRFVLRRFGFYTLRFTYKGGSTVAGGTFKQTFRITRTFF
jgi:hypothetical protein